MSNAQVEGCIKQILVYTAWFIWKARNERLFQHTFMTPTNLVRCAFINYSLNRQPANENAFENQSWNWEVSNPIQHHTYQPKLVRWLPPPMGALKLNFDASVTSTSASVAYIIRDCHGVLTRAGGNRISHIVVPYAELIAAWTGVKVALVDMKIMDLLVEGLFNSH